MADKKKVAIGLGIVGVGGVIGIIVLATKAKAAPPIPPAEINLSDLTIDPPEVNPGEKVTISVIVTNIGGMKGSYEVILGGDFTATKTVTLEPGESKAVSFKVTPTELGVYSVSVDGLAGSFRAILTPPVIDGKLLGALWRLGPPYVGGDEIIAGEQYSWPLDTPIETLWEIENTGSVPAVFTVNLLGFSASRLINPGESKWVIFRLKIHGWVPGQTYGPVRWQIVADNKIIDENGIFITVY